MTSPLTADISLDGYQLVRFLGRGGLGEVWLCRSGATGSYHGLEYFSDPESVNQTFYSRNELARQVHARVLIHHLKMGAECAKSR
jgi:hypothetical protein